MSLQDALNAKWRLFQTGGVVCLILSAMMGGAGLFGQDARGRIAGRVSDQSGSPVPHATIEATQDGTGVKFSATPNETGSHELLYLAPGAYSLAVSAQGFETVKQAGVEVRMTDRLVLDFPLTVGQVSESITVSGRVSLVDSASASLGQITDTHRIVELYELPFGRGKRLLSGSGRRVNAFAGGWQAAASCQHITWPALGFGNALLVAPIGDIPLHSNQTIDRWFNTDAFDRKEADALGSNLVILPTRFSGVRGPAIDVWNMSGTKTFSLPDRMKLEFRAEFLIALNHTNLANPNMTPRNAAFGSITSTPGNQRSIVFRLKLVY